MLQFEFNLKIIQPLTELGNEENPEGCLICGIINSVDYLNLDGTTHAAQFIKVFEVND